MSLTYDKRSGQYRNAQGKYTSRAEVLRLLDAEAARLEVRLQGHARLLVSRKIDLKTFQIRMAEDLKYSFLRTSALASGGHKQLTNQHFGTVGRQLRDQYKLLDRFGVAIAAGELSEKQILARSKQYGISTRSAFFAAEKVTRKGNGFNVAKRSLDSQAMHCAECLSYTTRGKWVPIDQVVMPGISCSCRSRCRCRCTFARMPFIGAAS